MLVTSWFYKGSRRSTTFSFATRQDCAPCLRVLEMTRYLLGVSHSHYIIILLHLTLLNNFYNRLHYSVPDRYSAECPA